MANYTAADVKRLREVTGAGMMDCKNALVEADGSFDAAVEALRIKGAKDVGKRAQRTAAQGLVTAELNGNSEGVLVELNCETDFVAKTEQFQKLATDIAVAALKAGADDRLAVLGLEVRPGQATQELIEEAGATLKEKLELGRYVRFGGGYVTSYLHKTDPALPPTIGVLVQLDDAGAGVAQEIALQIGALRPQYVTRDDVPEDVIANERRIAEEVTREEGKPEQAIPKIVEGRVNAFLKDIVLVEQVSVRDQKKSVKQLLAEHGATVQGFARFQIGQAG
ncbi:MAG TPA: translation elongation factor Ts [Streptosporangiaceae bacterium]|jgi:elongation factor Ts|nr:translation elongation factor Ts [Streptosporangiaceae bacterium]